MHMPSKTSAQSCFFLENLGQHRPHVDAFGDRVKVVSVGACQSVVGAQKSCKPCPDCFLAHRCVELTVDFSGGHPFETRQLKRPHPHHVAIALPHANHDYLLALLPPTRSQSPTYLRSTPLGPPRIR